ncbi:AraC family transcriptional regulator [Labrenzia sp. PHM005]|uniref:AraC family transcriptional regulator n=1 Tax=Labrenzia sp. PHM005 TaxID=2590016 RepID=UPI00143DD15E|nr:AraC family transcriptional regulator [Labrenzia sp. PHM005]
MTVEPFLKLAKQRGADSEKVFRNIGLREQDVRDAKRLVHAEVVYGLIHKLAIEAGDPYLGVHVGEQFNVLSWPHWAEASRNANVLSEVLIQLIESIKKMGSSTTHVLEVGSSASAYRAVRKTVSGNPPDQVDGFGLATLIRLFRQIDAEVWDPKLLHYKTAYLDAIPSGYMGVSISRCPPGETSLIFPTEWLHASFHEFGLPPKKGPVVLDTPSTVLAIQNVSSDIFELEKRDARLVVAERLGISTTDLDAALKSEDTTFQKVIQSLRIQMAKELLLNTDDSVSRIGTRLGFAEAGNFTRFFKSKVGVTPRAFRRSC